MKWSDGSSPRVRGTATRLMPMSYAAPVHPRVCGEQVDVGKLFVVGRRFIPACAGNRRSARRSAGRTAVHPRVCGEQTMFRCFSGHFIGSSPRVRGTARTCRRRLSNRRFIPACAGNRIVSRKRTKLRPVHPRVCGEQVAGLVCAHQCSGSSPRVRGTVPDRALPGLCHRFIPACAGNSACGSSGTGGPSVHPRVCGEQRAVAQRPHERAGSSPRVRGTDSRFVNQLVAKRFIPACAGNSRSGRSGRTIAPVHPRVCGEQVRVLELGARHGGSSPRVRGTVYPLST